MLYLSERARRFERFKSDNFHLNDKERAGAYNNNNKLQMIVD